MTQKRLLFFLALPLTGSAFQSHSSSSALSLPTKIAWHGSVVTDTKPQQTPRSYGIHLDQGLFSSRSSNIDRKPAWPRRLWSKITRKRPLHMQTMEQETEAMVETVRLYSNATSYDFIQRNFDTLTPQAILPTMTVDSEFYNVSLRPAQPVKSSTNNKTAFFSRWLGKLLEGLLTGLLERHALEPPQDLQVQAFPNDIGSLLQGQFRFDAQVDVGKLAFPPIRISSGRLEVQRLTLQLGGFLGQSSTRFPKQFDLHAHDWVFSQQDLLLSPCIRNGLRRLLVRILRDRGVQLGSIQVTSIDILPSGKISIQGNAKTLFDSPLHFEVRSGIGFTSRGHVLTFPGLEVSLNVGLFLPVVPTIDIDVGHNAQFRDICIDGQKKQVRLSASVTITPHSTIHLNDYRQTAQSFSARFSTDVGKWLTKIGNFQR